MDLRILGSLALFYFDIIGSWGIKILYPKRVENGGEADCVSFTILITATNDGRRGESNPGEAQLIIVSLPFATPRLTGGMS